LFNDDDLGDLDTDLKGHLECSIDGSMFKYITLAIMHVPVISRYGHTYESLAISTWLMQKQVCPITKSVLTIDDLVVNKNVFWFIKYQILKRRYNKNNTNTPIYDKELLLNKN
jgi:hypothetical protein